MTRKEEGKQKKSAFARRNRTGLIFLIPSAVLCLTFIIYPLITVVYYSMTDWDGMSKEKNFIGLYHYMHVSKIDGFAEMMVATFTFALGVTALTILISFILALVGQLAVYISNGVAALFYVGLALIGFCFGSLMGIYPGFTASQFGSKYNSVNYGIMFVGFALAGYFGPSIMNSLHTSTGEYRMAFLAAAALSVAGIVLNFVFRAMQKNKA